MLESFSRIVPRVEVGDRSATGTARVLQPRASATLDTLKQHVRENLANYNVSRDIMILDELPP